MLSDLKDSPRNEFEIESFCPLNVQSNIAKLLACLGGMWLPLQGGGLGNGGRARAAGAAPRFRENIPVHLRGGAALLRG
eukprot:g54155.t1